jgi:hypothetical protein
VIVGVVVVFGLIQLVPYRTKNPTVKQEPPWNSPQTRTLAVAACFDCHSNQTTSHWYEHVAPISWWTNRHVQQGRAALNFSEYDSSNHRSGSEIARRVQEGSMPPSYYTWFGLHSDAKLSSADRAALVAGLEATYGAGAGSDGRRGRRDRGGGVGG